MRGLRGGIFIFSLIIGLHLPGTLSFGNEDLNPWLGIEEERLLVRFAEHISPANMPTNVKSLILLPDGIVSAISHVTVQEDNQYLPRLTGSDCGAAPRQEFRPHEFEYVTHSIPDDPRCGTSRYFSPNRGRLPIISEPHQTRKVAAFDGKRCPSQDR